LKLYIEEEGSGAVRDWLSDASRLASSAVTYVEVRSALARRRRGRGLSPTDRRAIIRKLGIDWQRYLVIEVGDAVLAEAVRLADRHLLRAYDAVHLASATVVRSQLGATIGVASWDDDLDAAAAREGFDVLRARRR
jgi:predicted nucleic acid-binding protein